MVKLEKIYSEAVKFVEEKFPNVDEKEKRITILAVMKMLLELSKLEDLSTSKVQGDISKIQEIFGEDYRKIALKFNDKGSVSEIVPIGWIGGKWIELNEKLKVEGYKWISDKRKSRWIKREVEKIE